VVVLPAAGFRSLVESQPWESVEYRHDTWYQYAVCRKGVDHSVAA
jgi:hypothetical protein